MALGACNVKNSPALHRFSDFTNVQKIDNLSGQKFLELENKKTFDYIKETEIDGKKKGIYLWH